MIEWRLSGWSIFMATDSTIASDEGKEDPAPLQNRSSSTSGNRTIYSVPRRYDLATLFTVTLAYGLLFEVMQLLRMPPVIVLTVAAFSAVVGISQAVLFDGKSPRAASAIGGVVATCAIVVIGYTLAAYRVSNPINCDPFLMILGGALVGYVAGVFIGGVFLVADFARAATRRLSICCSRKTTSTRRLE